MAALYKTNILIFSSRTLECSGLIWGLSCIPSLSWRRPLTCGYHRNTSRMCQQILVTGWSRSPFLCSSIIVVSSIFVQFLWEEMNVFVRPAKAGGAGDGNKHRGRDWDLKKKSWKQTALAKIQKKKKKSKRVGFFFNQIQQQCCLCPQQGQHLLPAANAEQVHNAKPLPRTTETDTVIEIL